MRFYQRDLEEIGLIRKERIISAINHKETDIVPYYIGYTPPIEKFLQQHFKNKDVDESIGNHLLIVKGKTIRPMYADPKIYGDYSRDEFGVIWKNSPYDRGHVYKYPLTELNLKNYEFPDLRNPGRFDHVHQILKTRKDVFSLGWIGELWERCYFMMEFHKLVRALYTKLDFVEELLDRLMEYNLDIIEELGRFPLNGVLLSDDYGHQKGLQMNPNTWRKLIKPRLKRIFDYAKKYGFYTFLHSDGDITSILPDLIEIGLDVINPVQPEAMNPYEVKNQYGDKLCLWGALGTQKLLNQGTPEDIIIEVNHAKKELGHNGGYILGPAINLQKDVPPENILTLINQAKGK